MDEYKNLIKLLNKEKKSELKEKVESENSLLNESLIKTLQSLIDEGELIHAFFIYSTFKDFLEISDMVILSWSKAYIDLLRLNNFYLLSNVVIKESKVEAVRKANQVLNFFN